LDYINAFVQSGGQTAVVDGMAGMSSFDHTYKEPLRKWYGKN